MNAFTPKLVTTILACTALLSGCFDFQVVEPDTVKVSGKVTKGPMVNAQVNLYAMDTTGIKTGSAVATATTDANGAWSVTVPAGSGMLLVEASGGSYVDESDPEPDNAKKRSIVLAAGEVLEGILAADGTSAAVTVVSHALVRQAREESVVSDFATALALVKTRAATAYGFDPLVTQPASPLAPASTSTTAEKNYALVLGGLAHTMNDAAVQLGKAMVDYQVIDLLAQDLSDCAIDGKHQGVAMTLDVAGVSKTFPVDLDWNANIRRFLNNNFKAYPTGWTVPSVTVSALCQAAPVAGADSAGVSQGGSITIDVLTNDSDPEGGALTVVAVATDGTTGSVVLNGDNTITYTAGSSFVGADTFTYTVRDVMNTETTATVSVQVYSYAVDTDGDGYSDAHEIMAGTDPNDALSKPAGTLVAGGTMTTSGVWNLAGSPYQVQSTLMVSGASLVIETGVVVKFAAGTGLTVASGSTLDIKGDAATGKQVIFTSLQDDSVLGDTNGDGTATSATPGDWTGVLFDAGSSSNVFTYLDIHYAALALKVFNTSVGTTVTGLSTFNSSAEGLWVQASFGANIASPVFQDVVVNTSTGSNGINISAGTGATVAPVFTGANDISGIQTNSAAIQVFGSASPTISGFTTHDGSYGLQVAGLGNGTYSENVFSGAYNSGVLLNTTGVVHLRKNLILNNGIITGVGGGVEIQALGDLSTINHNVIRGNTASDGGGIYVGAGIAAANKISIGNNLILQNIAKFTGGGVSVFWVPSAAGNNWFSYNTITENTVNTASKGGGLYVGGSALVGLGGNIISGNVSDQVVSLGTVSSAYNLTSNGSLTDPTDLTEASGSFVQNWYLNNTSAAVNGDLSASGFAGPLLEFATLTTQVGGAVDGSSADKPDIGYHHFAAAPNAANATNSSLSATSITAVASTPYTVILTPKDVSGNTLGAALDVDVAVSGTGTGTLGTIVDYGDGRYGISYTTGTGTGNKVLSITVNSTALTGKSVTIIW